MATSSCSHSTPARAVRSWAHVAARASHPAAPNDDASWLWSIASGLASASVPWPLTGARPPTTVASSLLLETAAYRAWSVAWPLGRDVDLDGTLHVHSFCVVDGELEVSSPLDGVIRSERYPPAEGGVLTVPSARVRSTTPLTTAVHVLLLGPELELAPLPWATTAEPHS